MKFQVSRDFVELIDRCRDAFERLNTNHQFTHTYSASLGLNEKLGKQDYLERPARYVDNAHAVVDELICRSASQIFDAINHYQPHKFMPAFAERAALAFKVNSMLENSKVNDAARYLGPNRVPQFVDNASLYEKMLWLRWLLINMKQQIEQGIIPDMAGLMTVNINMRMTGVDAFISQYQALHPEPGLIREISDDDAWQGSEHSVSSESLFYEVHEPSTVTSMYLEEEEQPSYEESMTWVNEEIPSALLQITAFEAEESSDAVRTVRLEYLNLIEGLLKNHFVVLSHHATSPEQEAAIEKLSQAMTRVNRLQSKIEDALLVIDKSQEVVPVVEPELTVSTIPTLEVDETINMVIIGAGPVGLWLAIQLKTRMPTLQMVILERYDSYRRTQTLQLNLKKIKNEAMLAVIQSVIEEHGLKRDGDILYIPVPLLQQYDTDEALKLGVKIATNVEFVDEGGKSATALRRQLTLNDIERLYPNARALVAADGAHSVVRRSVFGGDDVAVTRQDVQHLIEFKYIVSLNGNNFKLNYISHGYATEKLAGFRCDETVKRMPDKGLAEITLRFFVTKDMYDALGEASFAKPIVDLSNLPRPVEQAINVWLNARELVTGERYHAQSGKINKITLSIYTANDFCTVHNGVGIFVIGDAAFGVPYFRALNAGLSCVNRSLDMFVRMFERGLPPIAVVSEYNNIIQNKYETEASLARRKNFGLDLWKTAVNIGGSLPLELNAWSRVKRQRIFGSNVAFFSQRALNASDCDDVGFARSKIIEVCMNFISGAQQRWSNMFYLYAYDLERANNLKDAARDSRTLHELISLLANFIHDGRTKRDKQMHGMTFSRFMRCTLRSDIIKAFCPSMWDEALNKPKTDISTSFLGRIQSFDAGWIRKVIDLSTERATLQLRR